MSDPVARYLALRDEVSDRAARLFREYAASLTCKRGCYFCCDEITVLPIELELVRRAVVRDGPPPAERLGGPPDDRGETPAAIVERDARRSRDRSEHGVFVAPGGSEGRRCALLGREGECTIYADRPLICRTHGLPLAYRVYEYDRHGRELRPDNPAYTDLWCDLNFRELADAEAPALFDRRGRINQDAIDRELERLNAEFLATDAGRRWRGAPPGEERRPIGIVLPGRRSRDHRS